MGNGESKQATTIYYKAFPFHSGEQVLHVGPILAATAATAKSFPLLRIGEFGAASANKAFAKGIHPGRPED